MTPFLIEISSTEDSYINDDDSYMTLRMSDYIDIMKLIKDLYLMEEFQKNVTFECGLCRSFTVTTRVLFEIIEKAILFMDSGEFENSTESWGRVYDSLWDMREQLTVSAYLTDKEWNDYYATGLKNMDFIISNTGELMTDSAGNPVQYISEDTIISFNRECECSSITDRSSDN